VTATAVLAGGCAFGAVAVAASPGEARMRVASVARRGGDTRPASEKRQRQLLFLGIACGFVLWLLAGTAVAVAVLCVVGAGVYGSLRAAARRRERDARIAVIEFCRAISAELRAGRAANAAFCAAAATTPESLRAVMSSAVDVAARGDPAELAEAIDATSVRSPAAFGGLHHVAACWRVVSSSGAMLAPAIDRIGDALQDEAELERALAGSLAAPRATVRILACLPVVGLLLGTAVGAHPLSFLFGSPAGAACLVAAAAFDAAGIWWAQRIAARAARLG
jgi:tight adherence protein B